MEFLRFGSSIPGSYWGCCACDVIQNFKVMPDQKASIQMLTGDSGSAIGDKFAGPTYKDIFLQRLRVGTFGGNDMPNHAFIAILTEWQISSSIGKAWLEILREAGFEFVRTVNNSVYSGSSLAPPKGKSQNNDNHIFMLVRNIGAGSLKDPYTPPKAWTDLPKVTPELSDQFTAKDGLDGARLTLDQHKIQTDIWNKIGPAKFLTRAEVIAAGAPVILGGQRSKNPQEPEEKRKAKEKQAAAMPTISNAFPVKAQATATAA